MAKDQYCADYKRAGHYAYTDNLRRSIQVREVRNFHLANYKA